MLVAGSRLAPAPGQTGHTKGESWQIPSRVAALASGPSDRDVGHGLCPGHAQANMLRITVQPEPDRIRLKLEGDLAGTWVGEAEDSWRQAHSMRGERTLYVDLTAVERLDRAGRYLLGLLRHSGAHLIASGTMMTELVQTIEDDWPVASPVNEIR